MYSINIDYLDFKIQASIFRNVENWFNSIL